jgi:hypothetical protein
VQSPLPNPERRPDIRGERSVLVDFIAGWLAAKFPETKGKRVVIQVDCHDVPEAEVAAFFDAFPDGVLRLPDYRRALQGNAFAAGIAFEIRFDTLR